MSTILFLQRSSACTSLGVNAVHSRCPLRAHSLSTGCRGIPLLPLAFSLFLSNRVSEDPAASPYIGAGPLSLIGPRRSPTRRQRPGGRNLRGISIFKGAAPTPESRRHLQCSHWLGVHQGGQPVPLRSLYAPAALPHTCALLHSTHALSCRSSH